MLAFGEGFSVQSASDAEFTAPSQYALTSPANGQMRVTDVAERRACGSTAALAIADRQSLPPGNLVLTVLAGRARSFVETPTCAPRLPDAVLATAMVVGRQARTYNDSE